MANIEVVGKSIEEAVQAAAAELKIPGNEVQYEILDPGSKGILGIGMRPAKIKAWSKQAAGAEKPEVREKREERRERPPRRAAEERPPRRPADERPPRRASEERPPRRPAEERPPRRPAEERPPSPPRQAAEERAPERREEPKAPAPEPTPAAPPPVTAGEEREKALALLRDVLAAMHIEATAQVRSETEEEMIIDIAGSELAILIGKQGHTLDALQFVLGIAVSRGARPRRRIILDVEGYRDRHAEMLRHKAHEYARQVKESGQEAELDPQPARDRRIIHTELANDPEVYTYSEGEGDDRHVVISPRK